MSANVPLSGDLTLAIEDPRDPDSAALIGELVAYIGSLYPEDEDEDEAPRPWSTDDMARDASFLVARVEGVAAGCGGLVPVAHDGALEIVRMYVRPAFRGRRIADQVLTGLETMAVARDAKALILRCGPRQPDALRVYERNGYVRRGVFAHHRDHATNIFFEKQLAPGAAV